FCSTASISRLSFGAPGFAAGPRLPPVSRLSRLSRERPLERRPSLWQGRQFVFRIGRTLVSKKETACGLKTGVCCAAQAKAANPADAKTQSRFLIDAPGIPPQL